jgi:hypothetical protein
MVETDILATASRVKRCASQKGPRKDGRQDHRRVPRKALRYSRDAGNEVRAQLATMAVCGSLTRTLELLLCRPPILGNHCPRFIQNRGETFEICTRRVTPILNPSNPKMANAWAAPSAHSVSGTTNIRRQPERPSAKASSPSVALSPTWSHRLHPNFIGGRWFHPKGRPELKEGVCHGWGRCPQSLSGYEAGRTFRGDHTEGMCQALPCQQSV